MKTSAQAEQKHKHKGEIAVMTASFDTISQLEARKLTVNRRVSNLMQRSYTLVFNNTTPYL